MFELGELEEIVFKASKYKKIDMHPSPQVMYQHKLECMSALCDLICEKYREEVVWADNDED